MAPRLGLGGGITADPASGLFASTPLLLDTYPNAHIAYSVRKLRTEYTGHAMKIRVDASPDRVADVAFDDDGFVSASSKVYNRDDGGTEGVTLAAFVDTDNEVYVHTWYDQSGEGSNATDRAADFSVSVDPANQPKIYTSNSLITDDTGSGTARAALQFDSSDRLHVPNDGLSLGSTSVFSLFRHNNTSNHTAWSLVYSAVPARYYIMYQLSSELKWYYDNAIATSLDLDPSGYGIPNIRRLVSTLAGSSAQAMIVNGTTISDASPSYATTALAGHVSYSALGFSFTSGLTGFMQEFIVYDSDQTSNSAGITSAINTVMEVY
tara:strand:- start:311 stop:1276 length:966 start_codon:yes stop_codon:yes gene_type:complete